MTRLAGMALLAGTVSLAACASSVRGAPAAPAPGAPAVPSALVVSPDLHLAHTFFARGVQIYECRASVAVAAGGEWVFQAPEADLFATRERTAIIGRHRAGPVWELADGSRVTGHVRAKVTAPDGKGVDWLLLDAVDPSGPSFAGVTMIRRSETAGGNPPAPTAAGCTIGETRRVDYTATYELFAAM